MFHFIYARHRVDGLFPFPTGIEDSSWDVTPQFPSWEGLGVGSLIVKSPLEKGTTPISPLTKGDRGGCKLVLVKTGIAVKNTTPFIPLF